MNLDELLGLLAIVYLVDAVVRVDAADVVLATDWQGRFAVCGAGWRLPAPAPWMQAIRLTWSDAALPFPAARHARWLAVVPWLQGLCTALALAVFAGVPWSLSGSTRAVTPGIGGVLLAIVGLHVAILAIGVSVLRACDCAWGQVARVVGPMVLVPVESMRALPRLGSAVYAGSDPYAVAAALLTAADLRVWAHEERERLSATAGDPGDARGAALARATVLLDDAVVPVRRDPGAAGYCPVCRTEYRAGPTTCSDCAVAIVSYPHARRSIG